MAKVKDPRGRQPFVQNQGAGIGVQAQRIGTPGGVKGKIPQTISILAAEACKRSGAGGMARCR